MCANIQDSEFCLSSVWTRRGPFPYGSGSGSVLSLALAIGDVDPALRIGFAGFRMVRPDHSAALLSIVAAVPLSGCVSVVETWPNPSSDAPPGREDIEVLQNDVAG